MARKKQEVQLQAEIETQEEWDEMLGKEGLHVIDIYQEWSGPCKAMLSNFKRVRNELGDDLLHFVVAKADTVDALERYRGKCEPCFLFFAGGSLVEVIRGCNAPVIMKTITKQLHQEHRVLDGLSERKEIRDPLIKDLDDREKSAMDEDESEKDEEEKVAKDADNVSSSQRVAAVETRVDTRTDDVQPDAKKKEVTVAIIKPDVVEAGKVAEILEQMKEAGIEILQEEERQLTEDEAREFYSHKKEEEYFDDLVKFMSSGPSHVLVLTKGETGENIIQSWKDLLGPPNVEDAKDAAPESWRAKYGKEKYANALHGSDSQETAMRELGFFFPNFVAPTVPGKGKKQKVQRTLALIRPDALRDKKDEIIAKIEESGFKVALQKEVNLTKEMAEEFYKEHQGQEYFEELTTRMSSGPLLALALAREEAVDGWRDMLGPKEVEKAKEDAPQSLRAQFSQEGDTINPLHGSDSPTSAQKELEFFFPMQQTVAAIKPDAYQTKDEIMERIREAGFHIAARKETTISPEMAAEFYSDLKDREYFQDLTDHMTSGPTLFMVLSREDAVEGWRSLIGPTDPSEAKEKAPDSLRAKYGVDIKSNAVHGSSNAPHVQRNISIVFGDLEFNQDGAPSGDEEEKREPEEQQAEAREEDKQEEAAEQQEAADGAADAGEAGGEQKEDAAETEQAAEEQPAQAAEAEQEKAEEKAETEEQEKEEAKDEAKDGEAEQRAESAQDKPAESEEKPEEQQPESQEEKKDESPAADEGQAKEEDKPADDKPVSRSGSPDKPGSPEKPASPEAGTADDSQKAEEDQKPEEDKKPEEEQKEAKKEEEQKEEGQKTEEATKPDEQKKD